MDGWESTSLAGATEGVLSNKYLRFGTNAAGSFASYRAAAVVNVELFGVSPDKTCQNKPVPFW